MNDDEANVTASPGKVSKGRRAKAKNRILVYTIRRQETNTDYKVAARSTERKAEYVFL